MPKRLEIYKCEHCGNIVEVFHGGSVLPTCCGEDMKLMEEQTADSTTEKHVPVIEEIEGGYKVTVGSTLHPMTDAHYIEWIELIAGDEVLRKHLNPSDEPVATFKTDAKKVVAREYCNLHGLWKSEK